MPNILLQICLCLQKTAEKAFKFGNHSFKEAMSWESLDELLVGSAPNWECWFHTYRVEQFPKWCKAILLWFAIVWGKAVSRQPKTPGDILSLTRIPLESSCQEIKELCPEGRGIKEERAGETSTFREQCPLPLPIPQQSDHFKWCVDANMENTADMELKVNSKPYYG